MPNLTTNMNTDEIGYLNDINKFMNRYLFKKNLTNLANYYFPILATIFAGFILHPYIKNELIWSLIIIFCIIMLINLLYISSTTFSPKETSIHTWLIYLNFLSSKYSNNILEMLINQLMEVSADAKFYNSTDRISDRLILKLINDEYQKVKSDNISNTSVYNENQIRQKIIPDYQVSVKEDFKNKIKFPFIKLLMYRRVVLSIMIVSLFVWINQILEIVTLFGISIDRIYIYICLVLILRSVIFIFEPIKRNKIINFFKLIIDNQIVSYEEFEIMKNSTFILNQLLNLADRIILDILIQNIINNKKNDFH